MKITRETLQQIIKEEVAKEINEEYKPEVHEFVKRMQQLARDENMDEDFIKDLGGMAYRHGGGEASGDFDKEAFVASGEMDSYDI